MITRMASQGARPILGVREPASEGTARTSNTRLAILVGVLLLLVAAAGVVFLVLPALEGQAQFDPTTNAFLAHVESGDYAAAYGSAGTALKEKIAEADFERTFRGMHEVVGKLQRKGSGKVQGMVHSSFGTFATVGYDAEFANGPGVITFVLHRTLTGWEVVGFHVNSPLFERKCSACGAALTPAGKFCPSCGKAYK